MNASPVVHVLAAFAIALLAACATSKEQPSPTTTDTTAAPGGDDTGKLTIVADPERPEETTVVVDPKRFLQMGTDALKKDDGHGHAHAPADALPRPRSAQDGVSRALYVARYTTAETLLRRWEKPGAPSDAIASLPPGFRRIRFEAGGNNRGETEDCGCPRNPLGGLSRRATMLGQPPRDPPDIAARFHVDAGDLLFRTWADGKPTGDETERYTDAIFGSLAAMGIDALVPGPRDLSRGCRVWLDGATRHKLPIVAANLTCDGTRLPPTRVVARGGVRIGFTGALGEKEPQPELWTRTGSRVSDPVPAVVSAIRALRQDKVDLVVLLSGDGLDGAEKLVRDLLAAGESPDIVFVSGTARMLREPAWVDAVPLIEPGSQSKFLARVDLFHAPGVRGFQPPGDEVVRVLREWMVALRTVNVTETRLRRTAGVSTNAAAEDSYARLLEAQYARLNVAHRALDALVPKIARPDQAAAGLLLLDLAAVELSIAEDPKVRAVLDAAPPRKRTRGGVPGNDPDPH